MTRRLKCGMIIVHELSDEKREEWAKPTLSVLFGPVCAAAARALRTGKATMAKKKITDLIGEIAAGFLQENGLELYHTEFVKEGRDWFLRVYIDKADPVGPDGQEVYVSTDDCERVSRWLSEELDRLDPIEQNYYLEVSSPGMDRQLLTQRHYEKYAGRLVEVKLYKGVDGKKVYEGILQGLTDGSVVIRTEDGQEMMFPLEQVAKTNLAVVF